jgi:hypothetical protein
MVDGSLTRSDGFIVHVLGLGADEGQRRAAAAQAGRMSDRVATTEAREEGFYWVILGQNPPEIASTGSAANGGSPGIPSPGKRTRRRL